MNSIRLLPLGLCVFYTSACAPSRPSINAADAAIAPAAMLHVEPGKYGRVMDEARDELRDLGFILDRVDAQLGVITTQPKDTGGIATPWDQEQSGIDDKLEDALQRQQRVVRIDFAPQGLQPGAAEIVDLRQEKGPIDAQISVTVYRVNQPGWRLNPLSMLNSSYTHDPDLDARGMGSYSVARRQDYDLALRIAGSVRERMAAR